MGAGEALVHVVVCIDEPRQNDMLRGIENAGDGVRFVASGDELDDFSSIHDNSPLGVFGEASQRILDPQSHDAFALRRGFDSALRPSCPC